MTRTATPPPLDAGVVGLGMIGGGVAVSLARSGRTPAVHDIRSDAADGLDGVPAPLGSPAEVARDSDVIMVAVVDADQARSVITGPDGLLSAVRPGATVVLLSTVALPVVHELAAACRAAEVRFLDCGVTPGDKAAEHGMVAIVGGAADDVEHARPVLADWAGRVVHCGQVGAGMATKIARNVITYGSWRATAEAAALCSAAGVDPATLTTVIEAADPDGATLLQLLRMRAGGVLEDGLSRQIATLMAKDLDAALSLARELGVGLPATGAVRQHVADTLGRTAEDPTSGDAVTASDDAASARPPMGAGASPSASSPAAGASPDRRERGLALMEEVYGPAVRDSAGALDTPFTEQTVDYLFGEVWARPGLSVRDRRLLTLGVAAATGRSDLIRIQAAGALESAEFTPGQLHEAVLHLALYVGWCNATATHQGVTDALADHTRTSFPTETT